MAKAQEPAKLGDQVELISTGEMGEIVDINQDGTFNVEPFDKSGTLLDVSPEDIVLITDDLDF